MSEKMKFKFIHLAAIILLILNFCNIYGMQKCETPESKPLIIYLEQEKDTLIRELKNLKDEFENKLTAIRKGSEDLKKSSKESSAIFYYDILEDLHSAIDFLYTALEPKYNRFQKYRLISPFQNLPSYIAWLIYENQIYLSNIKDEFGRNLLHTAALNRNLNTIKIGFAYGISPDVQDNDGYTPLHHVIQNYTEENTLKLVNLLLENGAQTNIKTYTKEGREGFNVYQLAKGIYSSYKTNQMEIIIKLIRIYGKKNNSK